jgi:hypothetical protein
MDFQKVFFAEYITEHEDKEFSEYVTKKVKCFICHQGKSKKNHNPYGIHLVKLLDKKEDKKDTKKIKAALEKVGKLHSDPKDDKSPTYAELIAQSKLPGGTLEEARKEPPKKEGEEAQPQE